MADVRLALAGAFDLPAPPPVALPETAAVVPQLQVWQRPIPLVIAGLLVAVVSSLAVWTAMRPDVIPAGLVRFAIVPPDTAPLGSETAFRDLAISSDGTQIISCS